MYKFDQLRKETTHTTVSTVCATTLFRCLIYLDMLDNQVAGVETLGIRVCFGVLEENEEGLGRFDGPAGTSDTELLACSLRHLSDYRGTPAQCEAAALLSHFRPRVER